MPHRPFDPLLGSWRAWHDESVGLRLGVSSCLLGNEVRYNGGHSRNRFVVDVLGRWFEWVPVCPEVEIGMGTPRPTVRLEADADRVRMVRPSTGEDFTRRMSSFAGKKVRELARLDLDGFIVKQGSPSCGMERVKVWGDANVNRRNGVGLFARALMERWPALPVAGPRARRPVTEADRRIPYRPQAAAARPQRGGLSPYGKAGGRSRSRERSQAVPAV
jgi:uncharacterized protein YbbK (DUF523 family)